MDAHGVLADPYDRLVLQDGARSTTDGAQVVGHEEGGGHDGPQGHLRSRLVRAKAKVTNDQLENERNRKKKHLDTFGK